MALERLNPKLSEALEQNNVDAPLVTSTSEEKDNAAGLPNDH